MNHDTHELFKSLSGRISTLRGIFDVDGLNSSNRGARRANR